MIADKRTNLFMISVRLFVLTMAVVAGTCPDNRLLAQTQVSIGSMKDNTLYEDSTGSFSNGAGEHFFVGRTILGPIRRGVIAFAVADSVPAGSTITSVTLTLMMSRSFSGPQTVNLHRLLANWGEGTSNAAGNEGSGAPSTPNDATWIHTFFNTRFWTHAGGDFSPTVSASQSVSDSSFYTWGPTPQMISDIQAWVDSPSVNFGWMVLTFEGSGRTSKRFDTREDSIPNFRPVLTVSYTPVVGVERGGHLPAEFALYQNYPNPFNPTTTIQFDLEKESYVVIKIFNILGLEITTLVDGIRNRGSHSVIWEAKDRLGRPVGSGIYPYVIRAGNVILTRKMVFVK